MSMLVECPHCSTRVLPMAGRACPACRKDLDTRPDPEEEHRQDLAAAYALAAEQVRAGASPVAVGRSLTERGFDAGAASVVVSDLERNRAEAEAELSRKNMLYGALWCFGGIAVTAFSYEMASTGGGGGHFVMAWGAIIFGAIQFIRGLARSVGR